MKGRDEAKLRKLDKPSGDASRKAASWEFAPDLMAEQSGESATILADRLFFPMIVIFARPASRE
jgi:hypothetical protein